VQESNWFSAPSALRVYGQYLNLDKDHNGMLSKEELSRYLCCCASVHCGTLYNIPIVIQVFSKTYIFRSTLR